MKKYLYAILFTAAGLLTFTACDKESDEQPGMPEQEEPTNPYEAQIVGHWTVQTWSGTLKEEDGSETPFYIDNVTDMEIIFNADHTGQMIRSNDPEPIDFRYEFSVESSDDMFMIIYSETESYYCKIFELDASHLEFAEVMPTITSIYDCVRK